MPLNGTGSYLQDVWKSFPHKDLDYALPVMTHIVDSSHGSLNISDTATTLYDLGREIQPAIIVCDRKIHPRELIITNMAAKGLPGLDPQFGTRPETVISDHRGVRDRNSFSVFFNEDILSGTSIFVDRPYVQGPIDRPNADRTLAAIGKRYVEARLPFVGKYFKKTSGYCYVGGLGGEEDRQ